MTVKLLHPDYGAGTVLRLARGSAYTCSCESCRRSGEYIPEHLVFVWWDEARGGVAGGWYDPTDERFTVEGAVELARMVEVLG